MDYPGDQTFISFAGEVLALFNSTNPPTHFQDGIDPLWTAYYAWLLASGVPDVMAQYQALNRVRGLLHLPIPPPPIPPNPTYAELVNVQTGFCNHHDNVVVAPSTQGRPIFSPYFTCLPSADQLTWLAAWSNAKYTHQIIGIENPEYAEVLPQYGTEYPAPTFPPTDQQVSNTILLLRQSNLIPIVMLTNGAFPSDWPAFTARVNTLAANWKGAFLPCPGWEPYWTDAQWIQMFNLLRSVFGDGVPLAVHLPPGYVHNGNAGADWMPGGPFEQVDVFLSQMPNGNGDPVASGAAPRWQECYCRVCAPGTVPGPGCPCYMCARVRPLTVVACELDAYTYIRDQVDDAGIDRDTAWIVSNTPVRQVGNATEAIA